MEKSKMTREEWLQHAVAVIDEVIFKGELDHENHPYQIACGWCKSKNALGETVFPPEDTEDVTLDDFFPVTIHLSVAEKDVDKMIGSLIHECIHAFFNIRNHGKQFKKKANEVGFENPVTKYYPSSFLQADIKAIRKKMEDEYGAFPGKAVIGKKKEPKEREKKVFKLFCPNCGFECKANKNIVEKYGLPTCNCGHKLAMDMESDSEDSDKD